MMPDYITDEYLDRFIQQALQEDVGEGDHSTLCSVDADQTATAELLVKEDGILAGVLLARRIFTHFDLRLLVEVTLEDGASVRRGDIAFRVKGPARSILTTERLVLNCMQRMSGIATATRRLVDEIAGTNATVVDTRKTTPNFRFPEKWAVRIGGGHNHRMGLYDMVMLKDNHVKLAGGVREAILRAKDYIRATGKNLRVEIEVASVEQAVEAVETGGVDIIMLDNMAPVEMKAAVKAIAGRCTTEASGGITLETIRAVAETGVDFISVGALTHSVNSLDLSLKIRDLE
ncbi:MAG TPA: carboxylating nicotinate-nucleotide diphosphorylase [Cyclobacteriaceae bacterium]|nr:carboxylating nicotinate-nucleotide diphosphorylase [Cyclobacteriaceae bacterium]